MHTVSDSETRRDRIIIVLGSLIGVALAVLIVILCRGPLGVLGGWVSNEIIQPLLDMFAGIGQVVTIAWRAIGL